MKPVGRPRDWRRLRAVLLGVLAVGMLAGAFALQRLENRDEVKRVWYFDLNTRELFVGPYAAVPSIPAPSGPYHGADAEDLDALAGVAAMVVRPTGGGDPRVVYLQRYTAEGKLQRQRELDGASAEADAGPARSAALVIALPPTDDAPPRWCSTGSPQGKAILAQYGELMRGGGVEFYLPGD